MADLKAIKAAYAALPSGTTPETALPVLAAQTTTLTGQPIVVSAMFAVLAASSTEDWAKIKIRANVAPGYAPASPPTATDQAVLAAIDAAALFAAGGEVPPAEWPLVSTQLAALQAVGDVSAASVAAITALSTVTQPTFPGLTLGDIQTALAQP